jgi:dolichyl-phosphate-mannose-protein mannosyltransferase
MKKHCFLLFCIVFLVAFGLRFYNCTYPAEKFMDETGHVPAAVHYWNTGQFEPDHWEHPPLRPIILYGFLQVFGDNPYGWRIRNVLFGSFAAALTFLFALKTTENRKAALMAGLLATDPLHIVVSRSTFCEVYSAAFFLAAVVIYLWHNQRSSWLMLSAFLIGCAMATKWYYLPCWFLLYLLTLCERNNYRNTKTILFITCTYLFIPLTVYVMSFYMWFGRGYSFSEFIEFVVNVYNSLQQYTADNYTAGLFFLSHLSAAEWFTKPIIVGQGSYLTDGKGEFIIFMNNLPIWILTIPSLIGISILSLKKRCLKTALPALLFCSSYMLFVFVKRPAFLYSVVPMLPYAFTLIAYGITLITERYSIRIYAVALAAMLGWNLYLYPLVTSKKVPVAPYRYILNNKDIKIR